MHHAQDSSNAGSRFLPRLLMLALLASGVGLSGCNGTTNNDTADPSGEDSRKTDNDGFTVIRSNVERETDPNADPDTVEKLTSHNADFAVALYNELAADKEGENLFFSPHSISTVLAMTYAGANGRTATEMKTALRFELAEEKLHSAFNRLDLALESQAEGTGNREGSGDPFKLNNANSIWCQKGFSFQQPFLDTMVKHYDAGLRTLNFQEKPDASRKTINEWVSNQTENKIRDLLSKGSITNLTRMILTNAIYFNASWKCKFNENATKKGEFRTRGGSEAQVDMMRLKERNGLSYARGDAWKAVEMPYVGADMSMVVIVPDEGKFDQIENKLSGQWLDTLFSNLGDQALKLQFPKFDFKCGFSVKKRLQSLGMETAFKPQQADLTGISKAAQLFLQDVVHKAYVSVDEKGTEAAAATAVSVGMTSVSTFKEVSVDRPFIFTIRDRKTGAVVFLGRVLDPS